MDEGIGDVASPEEAAITAKRPTVTPPDAKQRRRRAKAGRGRRLLAQGLITLVGLLLIAGVAASLIESGWQSFNPVNGIGVFGQLPLQPQSFGDSTTFAPAPTWPVSQSTAAINGQTHKPTAKPTATVGSAGSGPLTPTYTGSWSGGTGQGCPGGGAPTPRPYVIYNAASYGAPHSNMVALTFDDGPTPNTTPPILDFLEQSHTPATFFVMGQYARAYPWLIQREAADGFAIGVHTWDHPDMRLLSPSARANELGSTIQQLHSDLGSGFCAWLWRPPYGAVNSGIVAQAGGFGLTTINWDVDPQDWARPGTMVIVQRVLSQVRPGSIILMHDGPAARQETAAALPYILAGLRQRGLVPVTVPTLLGSESAPTGAAPSPTATATATGTATPTATATATTAPSPTATDTPTAAPTATDTPTTTTGVGGGWLAGSSGGSFPSALSLWLWQNTVPGYSGG